MKTKHIKLFENFDNDIIEEYQEGKDFYKGKYYTTYFNRSDNEGMVNIEVKGGGWKLGTHNRNMFELWSNGRKYWSFSIERGDFSIRVLAKRLYDIAEKEGFVNYYDIDQYEQILSLYFKMKEFYQEY